MDTQSLPFFHPLGMIPQEAEEKKYFVFPSLQPSQGKGSSLELSQQACYT